MKEKPRFKQLLDASSVGIQLVISTFVGFAIGYLLDRTFNTSPWFVIIFLILGIASGFMELFKVARQQGRPEDDKKDN